RVGAHALDRRFEISLFAAHADSLAPAADVGREVRPDRHPGPCEQRFDRASHRRLAVRPDDVNRWIPKLWIAEICEERLDPLEPEAFLGPRAQRLDIVNG